MTTFIQASISLLFCFLISQSEAFASEEKKAEPLKSLSQTIILNTADIAPFHYLKNGHLEGLVPPIIDCTLKKMGQPYKVNMLPWIRAQKEVEQGLAQGFFAARKNDERNAYATPSDPVNYKIWNWYVRKDIELKPTDPEFKKKVFIGSIAGTDENSELKRDGYQLVTVNSAKQLVQMLSSKRIGAIRMIDVSMKDALSETGGNMNDFKVYFVGAYPNVCYFNNNFLKQNPDFLRRFELALGQCFNPKE